jgi:hypothetical protein
LAKYLCIGVVETWVWTADKQPVALLAKNDWAVQVIPQQAISDKGNKGHTGALYSKNLVCSGGRSWDGTFYFLLRRWR